MISQLKGVVAYKGAHYIIIDTGGIGYKVATPLSLLGEARDNEKIFLWTYLHVRENTLELYGFLRKEELDFFEMLIGISGIGPKSALSIVNLAPVKTLVRAIGQGDSAYMTNVSGIGRKTAEKIILELRDKLAGKGAAYGISELRADEEALEALKSLGYSGADARDALAGLENKDLSTGNKIKEALKALSRK